ncbi:hypothetical protein NKJ70_32090 [Mesorhizobium sp. M0092]
MMFVGPPHQAVLDACLDQPGMSGVGIISLIAIDRPFIAADQCVGRLGVGDRSVAHLDAPDQRMILVDADVHLVAEGALLALLAPARILVRRWLDRALVALLGLFRRAAASLQERGIDQRAALDDQALVLKLAVDLLEHLVDQPLARQLLAEAPQRRMVGRAVRKAEAGKAAERQPVADLCLKRWIAQPMPCAQQKAAHQHWRRIAGRARPGSAACAQKPVDRTPVDLLRNKIEDRLIRHRKAVRQAQLTKHTINHPRISRSDHATESPIRFCAKASQGEKVASRSEVG